MMERKSWGWTIPVYREDVFSVHKIHVLPGGFCSKHFHAEKHNCFRIIEGVLAVWFGLDDERSKTVLLGPGSCLEVPANFTHQFFNYGREPVTALETYQAVTGKARDEDIIRLNQNGLDESLCDNPPALPVYNHPVVFSLD